MKRTNSSLMKQSRQETMRIEQILEKYLEGKVGSTPWLTGNGKGRRGRIQEQKQVGISSVFNMMNLRYFKDLWWRYPTGK